MNFQSLRKRWYGADFFQEEGQTSPEFRSCVFHEHPVISLPSVHVCGSDSFLNSLQEILGVGSMFSQLCIPTALCPLSSVSPQLYVPLALSPHSSMPP